MIRKTKCSNLPYYNPENKLIRTIMISSVSKSRYKIHQPAKTMNERQFQKRTKNKGVWNNENHIKYNLNCVVHFLQRIFSACLFFFLTPDLATFRLLCTALNLERAAFVKSGLQQLSVTCDLTHRALDKIRKRNAMVRRIIIDDKNTLTEFQNIIENYTNRISEYY